MNHIDYFRLQAKNIHRDYKTQESYMENGIKLYKYHPKYFDIDSLFLDWYDNLAIEENFTYMKACHLIACMLGFKDWGELLKAPEEQLDFLHFLFDNEHHASLEEWETYMGEFYEMNPDAYPLDYLSQKELFNEVFIKGELFSDTIPYRLDCQKKRDNVER